ncbi:hypothetical protein CLV58_10130 [Spirosoma oryzae]|uniref:Uncharacterized protein n=1 Tax=Spirosoma oryzae TaxID=1469603 RepID=A0A2T0TMT1_9BACT|nr:hypothetical protein [Spirosoma oryzae]PRY46966.1 hypothetical protein CLV58_10130 [Spirosoma oryzae]
MGIKKPQPTQGKNVKVTTTSIVSPDIKHPVFCFRYLVKGFDLEQCEEYESVALIKHLYNLSQLTWEEIKLAPRHGMGSEKIQRNSIKASIPKFITDDVDYFLALRFQGKKPFVGHRSGSVFHIIWIDNKFTLYNH